MAAQTRGLGRGLDALLGGMPKESKSTDPGVRQLSLAAVRPNPTQPRRYFDEAALSELAESIKAQGVLQPVLVRPVGDSGRYELVAGERRWRASRLAGMKTIPAIVRELDDQESLAIAMIENLQREDLNPVEEARGYAELQEKFGLSQEQLASRVGKSRSAVANTLRLLQMPESAQQSLLDGEITAGHARALMSVGDNGAQEELRGRIIQLGLSVRQAEAQAAHWKAHGELPAMDGVVKTGGKKTAPKELDARLAEVKGSLCERFGLRVTCSGTSDKGRISFFYKDREELAALLGKLNA